MDPSEYERLVQQVCRELSHGQNVRIFHQREYVGRLSRRKIKVDVSFETRVLGTAVLVVVECKCYQRPVGVEDVEEFYAKLDDIGAHKGIVVTTVGYRDGAIKTARGRGIALALLSPERANEGLEVVQGWAGRAATEQTPDGLFKGNLHAMGHLGSDALAGGLSFGSVDDMIRILAYSLFDKLGNSSDT